MFSNRDVVGIVATILMLIPLVLGGVWFVKNVTTFPELIAKDHNLINKDHPRKSTSRLSEFYILEKETMVINGADNTGLDGETEDTSEGMIHKEETNKGNQTDETISNIDKKSIQYNSSNSKVKKNKTGDAELEEENKNLNSSPQNYNDSKENTKVDSKTEPSPEPEKESENNPKPEPEKEPETKPKPDPETEKEPEAEPQPEPEPETPSDNTEEGKEDHSQDKEQNKNENSAAG